MTDPKGEKPESDHPHVDDSSLELGGDQQGLPAAGEENPLDALGLSASVEEFHFSGPAEELDFTEPTDFAFPTQQAAEAGAIRQSGELAAAGQLFESDEGSPAGSLLPEAAVIQPELAGEGFADLEVAEEPAEEEKQKPKFELPGWVRTVEWVMGGLLAVGALLAIVISIVQVQNPTPILNIAFPLLLGLIPYALWRSSGRWVTPAVSAPYTVMLALSAAALIAGTWFEGLELARYDWQFNKARVTAAKPRPMPIAAPAQPAAVNDAPAAK